MPSEVALPSHQRLPPVDQRGSQLGVPVFIPEKADVEPVVRDVALDALSERLSHFPRQVFEVLLELCTDPVPIDKRTTGQEHNAHEPYSDTMH